jgi:hypothetical protein
VTVETYLQYKDNGRIVANLPPASTQEHCDRSGPGIFWGYFGQMRLGDAGAYAPAECRPVAATAMIDASSRQVLTSGERGAGLFGLMFSSPVAQRI